MAKRSAQQDGQPADDTPVSKPKATPRKTTGKGPAASSRGNGAASYRSANPDISEDFDSADGNLANFSDDMDISRVDDVDAAERYDLDNTGRARPHGSRGDGSIVELINETFDHLSLGEADGLEEVKPVKGKRAGAAKRNGHSAQASTPDTDSEVEILEVVTIEAEADVDEPEAEDEPDEVALAHVADVAEVENPEELEKVVDRALNMEGISVDDPVRIYLREIGRTALLKSPDESALAEKMAVGRAAQAKLAALESRVAKARLTRVRWRNMGSKHAKVYYTRASVLITPVEYEERKRILKLQIDEGARAKQQLVQANLRLVVSIARRYIGRGLSLLDLIQEGNIGLMKAADKFDHTKGYKFSTYATWWIRQAITRAISDQSRTIRLPVHVTEMVTRLRRAAHELQQKLLREPTEEELGAELNMPAERVRKILDMARHPASLDAPMEEGEDSFLGDFIEDERAATPMEEASRQMLKEQVEDILGRLTEREQQILKMRYGLTDDRPRTLEEVAKAFGITRERIRQIETRILRKLRYNRYGANKLKGYLD